MFVLSLKKKQYKNSDLHYLARKYVWRKTFDGKRIFTNLKPKPNFNFKLNCNLKAK